MILIRVLCEIEGVVEVAELVESVAGSEGGTGGLAVSSIVVSGRSGGIKLVIDAGKGGQIETTFDEFQEGGVFVQCAGDIAAFDPR